jgi:hypothetical protein
MEKIYILSEEQKAAIKLAQKEFKEGKGISSKKANAVIRKLLKSKTK